MYLSVKIYLANTSTKIYNCLYLKFEEFNVSQPSIEILTKTYNHNVIRIFPYGSSPCLYTNRH